jgi:hypothetical protein
MASNLLEPDIRGHTPVCALYCKEPVTSKDQVAYADLFCACHHWKEPKILLGGTNIAWPAGWTPEQALAWRAKNGLAAPAPI